MGIIIAKFRKKKSTYEVLEKLEKEIVSIEEFSRSTEQFRKKIITRFILLAVLIYMVLASILYFNYHKISSNQKWIYIVPFVAFPFVIFIVKKVLAWYYSRKLQRNKMKLVKLKKEKSKIIDNVMETETYKVAKKILDKFGNEPSKSGTDITSNLIAQNNPSGLRQRNSPIMPPVNALKTPSTMNLGYTPILTDKSIPRPFPASKSMMQANPRLDRTPLPLPRSILPSNRSVLDKLVDYLVGDGPSNRCDNNLKMIGVKCCVPGCRDKKGPHSQNCSYNHFRRYALICKKCFFHNGMALKEEFDYLSFRCCYCAHFNSAQKKKVMGPKFEASVPKITTMNDSTNSDKDTQDSDSEEREYLSEKSRSSSFDTPKQRIRSYSSGHISTTEPEQHSVTEKLSDVGSIPEDTQVQSGSQEKTPKEASIHSEEDFDSNMEVDNPTAQRNDTHESNKED